MLSIATHISKKILFLCINQWVWSQWLRRGRKWKRIGNEEQRLQIFNHTRDSETSPSSGKYPKILLNRILSIQSEKRFKFLLYHPGSISGGTSQLQPRHILWLGYDDKQKKAKHAKEWKYWVKKLQAQHRINGWVTCVQEVEWLVKITRYTTRSFIWLDT